MAHTADVLACHRFAGMCGRSRDYLPFLSQLLTAAAKKPALLHMLGTLQRTPFPPQDLVLVRKGGEQQQGLHKEQNAQKEEKHELSLSGSVGDASSLVTRGAVVKPSRLQQLELSVVVSQSTKQSSAGGGGGQKRKAHGHQDQLDDGDEELVLELEGDDDEDEDEDENDEDDDEDGGRKKRCHVSSNSTFKSSPSSSSSSLSSQSSSSMSTPTIPSTMAPLHSGRDAVSLLVQRDKPATLQLPTSQHQLSKILVKEAKKEAQQEQSRAMQRLQMGLGSNTAFAVDMHRLTEKGGRVGHKIMYTSASSAAGIAPKRHHATAPPAPSSSASSSGNPSSSSSSTSSSASTSSSTSSSSSSAATPRNLYGKR